MTDRHEVRPEDCPNYGAILQANRQQIAVSPDPRAAALAWFDAGLHGLLDVYGGPETLRMMEHSTEQVRLLIAPVDNET